MIDMTPPRRDLNTETLVREIGLAMIGAATASRGLGHSSIAATVRDYLHVYEHFTPEQAAALEFVKDCFDRTSTLAVAEKWLPGFQAVAGKTPTAAVVG